MFIEGSALKNSLLIASMIAALASPAFAADAPEYPTLADVPAPVVDNWSGFYAGVFGGYAVGTATTQTSLTQDIGVSGGMLGATIGANAQFDSFVIGVEGDLAWSGIEGTEVCAINAIFNCAGSLDWLSTVRGRAGVAFDSVLLYATAGIAISGVSATVTPVPLNATGEYSDTFIGWTAGFGGEIKLTDTISARAEYAYTDLGHSTAPAGTLTTTGDSDLSGTLHSVKLGLNFAF